MHTLKSNVFIFGGCNELCLKVVKERTWATTSSSMDMDHSMFTIIIKLESNKLKVLESKFQGVFCFLFLVCLFIHHFFHFMFRRFTMPPLGILKNFKFKPIFFLATNVETIDVEMFDLEPLTIASTLKPFATTPTSKPLTIAFALELVSKLVSQVCHTSTTKKKTKDYEGIK